MKIVILVFLLNIASVCMGLLLAPYKIYQVTNETFWAPQRKIYGGDEAPEGKFPFMIFTLMFTLQGTERCSASLIDHNWVLIAAHCVDDDRLIPRFIFLVGGKANVIPYLKARLTVFPTESIDEITLGVQERRAGKFFIHPKYDRKTLRHDLALIRLSKPFDLKGIETISISNDKMTKPKSCTILGWGLNSKNANNFKLNYVNNKLVHTTEKGCKFKYKEPFLCLKPDRSGICSGDSGGPLVCNNKVWGVASHFVYKISNECGKSLEEFYSEIYPDLDWIKQYCNGGNTLAVASWTKAFTLTGFWLFLRSSLNVFKV